jgi:hypothetical protein
MGFIAAIWVAPVFGQLKFCNELSFDNIADEGFGDLICSSQASMI